MRITTILGNITEHYRCGSLSELHRLNIESELLRWVTELPDAVSLYDKATRSVRPYDLKIRQLHVPFFVALIIFHRSDTPGQQFSLTSLLAASFVSGIFEEYIAWGDIMFLAPASIFYLLVASLIQVSSYRYPNLSSSADSEISTVRVSLKELGKRFPTAHGAERIFENLLHKARGKGTTSQSFSMTMSSEQRALLAPLGPELCASWLLMGPDVDGTDRRFIPERNSVLGEGGTQTSQNLQPEVGSGFIGVDSGFNGNALPSIQPEGLGDFALGGFDFWWPDWTELDC